MSRPLSFQSLRPKVLNFEPSVLFNLPYELLNSRFERESLSSFIFQINSRLRLLALPPVPPLSSSWLNFLTRRFLLEQIRSFHPFWLSHVAVDGVGFSHELGKISSIQWFGATKPLKLLPEAPYFGIPLPRKGSVTRLRLSSFHLQARWISVSPAPRRVVSRFFEGQTFLFLSYMWKWNERIK